VVEKMALLVFSGWLVCRQKPNVPFVGRVFHNEAQLPFGEDADTSMLWVNCLIF